MLYRCGVTALFGAVALVRSAVAQSDPPLHYYDTAIGKTGTMLKSALQSIIRNHTVLPYTGGTDTWTALKVLDQDPVNSNNVLLIYSGFTVPKSEQFNGSTGTWDREHLWPQSFGIIALNSNSRAKSDLFNIRPINVSVNSSRGNKYYDISTPPFSTRADAPGSSYDNDSWEPRDDEKGTISRSMFYMAVRYDGSDADVPDLELSDTPNANLYRFGKLTSLLAWNREFFPTASERDRNQHIYSDYQHNRNPFVDHPDYAEMVFNGVSPGLAWQHTQFTDAELANPLIGGDSGDPDRDDLKNLIEYTINGDPWKPDNDSIVTATVTSVGSTNNLYITYPHNRNATDLTLSYEVSSNLVTWTAAAATLISATVITSETEEVTVRISSTVSVLFARLRANR
ncbi:MAG: endonuclease [Verrucomicrobiota bacterium]